LIRTQAVVNEESADPDYWKRKFNELVSSSKDAP